MYTFRIDKRDFTVGDKILPQNVYQNRLDAKRRLVEYILEQFRPENKPARNSILMVFELLDDAKELWWKISDSKLYKTEILETEILHIGDYNKVEELYKCILESRNGDLIAQEYWNSILTENPIIEIFVNQATVSEVFSNPVQERHSILAKKIGISISDIQIIEND
jgi:hypothetical protein